MRPRLAENDLAASGVPRPSPAPLATMTVDAGVELSHRADVRVSHPRLASRQRWRGLEPDQCGSLAPRHKH